MPRIEWRINIGELMAFITLIVWAVRLEAKVTYVDEYGSKVVRELRQEIASLTTEIAVLNEKLSNLQKGRH